MTPRWATRGPAHRMPAQNAGHSVQQGAHIGHVVAPATIRYPARGYVDRPERRLYHGHRSTADHGCSLLQALRLGDPSTCHDVARCRATGYKRRRRARIATPNVQRGTREPPISGISPIHRTPVSSRPRSRRTDSEAITVVRSDSQGRNVRSRLLAASGGGSALSDAWTSLELSLVSLPSAGD